MKAGPLCVVAGSGLLLVGCGVVQSVYHGMTAPIRMAQHPNATPTPRTTDVVHPGHPIAGKATPTPARRVVERTHPTPTATVTKTTTANPSPAATKTAAKASPSPTKTGNASPTPAKTVKASPTPAKKVTTAAKASPTPSSSSQQQFPVGRPVPDKPGYVFSPYEPTKYVDVSGFAPGSKVKDPYSGKIFLVP